MMMMMMMVMVVVVVGVSDFEPEFSSGCPGKGPRPKSRIDFKFRDAFRDVNAAHIDATTHSSGARLDYIFLERTGSDLFKAFWGSYRRLGLSSEGRTAFVSRRPLNWPIESQKASSATACKGMHLLCLSYPHLTLGSLVPVHCSAFPGFPFRRLLWDRRCAACLL